ncbi:hypothetical protein ACFY1G_03555 [Streptomyces olivaceus]|uniref:Lipoprotein n=1 Tax=Streptomyces olivaceus TaxID=47716 RepID=A0ABS7VY73_STROV|nr:MULTISPECIES: hypothetical protein [Streptomyces]MBZ6087393.1 hypothetical protein [Streptomyces olivaceus]MBZ6094006.1 hypothetical protein [Streptomyces olivaceus]MBZ6115122.1 hypothetical protein [Streptomyces olivaceus]MBZ6150237.1 hypothetical protein [Streptomyces olivaceus]MBZ6192793.1 hypothetical protein [Streptomyces olivaceus]
MSVTPRRRIRRAALAGAACALVVTGAGLTGCGSEDPDAGTNGLGKLPADKIQAKARTTAQAADTVRLHGTVEAGGNRYTLDMRLKADGGTGSVAAQGTTFGLLRVGEQLFLKADSGFWSHDGGDAKAAGKLADKYVKVPQSDPVYKKFSGFTDKDVLLGGLLTLHGTVQTDGRHEQAGVRTIRITGDEGDGGSLDVSLEGTPYPLRLVRAGSAGTLDFSDWNKDFALEQPPKDDTLDYGKQLPTS